MPRLLMIGLAASLFAPATTVWGQDAVVGTLAASNELLSADEFEASRTIIIDALRDNPNPAERKVLEEQLDKISAAIPYYVSLDLNSTFTTGTRQALFADRLNWTGVPHYTDDLFAVEEAQASLINALELGAGYRFDLTPDVALSVGLEGEFNFYEETDFMEAWVGVVFAELDLSIGPVLANTNISYGLSSKSREKVDFNPNVPRVPGAYHYSVEQDIGFKFARDQVLGTEITYRQGDETENVQFPGIAFEHLTVEGYYDATWADALDTRVYGYGQVAATDPGYTGFLAYGAGVEMGLDLPAGFRLGGDLQYRSQGGFAPYPSRTDDLDVETMSGSVEIQNGHFSLRGLQPYLSAAFEDSSASYTEYTRSDLAFGAGVRLGF